MKKRVLSAVLALSLGATLLACGAKSDGNAGGDASAKAEEGNPKPLREKRRQRAVEKP